MAVVSNFFVESAELAPGTRRASNRYGVDYRALAKRLGPPPCPIFDFHTHVNGERAAVIWAEAADAFGVDRLLTMVPLQEAATVTRVLGKRVGLIAFPNFRAPDRGLAMRQGFLDDIKRFHDEHGSRMIKLWNAPRLREFFPEATGLDLIEFDGQTRVQHIELAQRLNMSVMVHIADPDTWFATKYADAEIYGAKRDHYRGLKVILNRFADVKFVAAHMGGYAEDLAFLDGLLAEHSNLSLDCSATKWMVRELSRYPAQRIHAFLTRWSGRVMFGSDLVSTDEHLTLTEAAIKHPMADLAESAESAFDLYASRYAAYRVMFERDFDGQSPIADPDLMMVDPQRYNAMDAPAMRGLGLDVTTLKMLYSGAAEGYLAATGWEV